jgi:alkanesulfonate monooxygenase SsuD/methylene tetrahydromethanopterin reductase-like flavin-dependent oxidoreductase (luciferase family)
MGYHFAPTGIAAYSAIAVGDPGRRRAVVAGTWGDGLKIGLTLPMAQPDRGPMPRYADIREAAMCAERDGFDSVWVYDHLLFRWENRPTYGIWESWSVLSALAEATSRVELGALVLCTAFRNPGLLAKMADAVDEISNGRLILGLGAGWHKPEFVAFGYPFDHLVSRFEESLRIVAPLLRTGAVDFRGTYESAIDCVSLPRGPRPDGPPILVGASGPRMLRLTAEIADAWNTCWLARADELPERAAKLHAACAEVRRDPATIEVTVGQMVTFPGLDQEQDPAGGLEKFTFADAQDLAGEFARFATQGVGHLMVWPTPRVPACVEQVSAALRMYRAGAA